MRIFSRVTLYALASATVSHSNLPLYAHSSSLLNVRTNLLRVAESVREKMAELQEQFPKEITASLSYDASIRIKDELQKIYNRTLWCVAILLLFVLVVTCPKEALITPINEHWTTDVTARGQLAWILKHLK